MTREQQCELFRSLRAGFASGSIGAGPVPVSILTITQQPNCWEYEISSAGSQIADGTAITAATGAALATLVYQVYLGGSLWYEAEIAPDGDPSVIGDWTYIGGSRTAAQFEAEIVDSVLSGSGFTWTLDKIAWGRETGYIDDGENGDQVTDLHWRLKVKDTVKASESITGIKVIGQCQIPGLVLFPFYLKRDDEGNIFFNDFTAHAVRQIVPSYRGKTNVLRTIAGAGPEGGAVSGNIPLYPNTVTGDLARFDRPEGIALSISTSKTNGYYDIFVINRNTKKLVKITRNTASDVNRKKEWDVAGQDVTATASFPKIDISPFQTNDGFPILFGGVGLADFNLTYREVFPDTWNIVSIDAVNITAGVSASAFANNYVAITYFVGGTPNTAIYQYAGSDPTDPANYTRLYHVKTGGNANYGIQIVRFDATFNLPVVALSEQATGQIIEYAANIANPVTTADWTATTIATAPGTPSCTGLQYDGSTNKYYVSDWGNGVIWEYEVDTATWTIVVGESGNKQFRNDIWV